MTGLYTGNHMKKLSLLLTLALAVIFSAGCGSAQKEELRDAIKKKNMTMAAAILKEKPSLVNKTYQKGFTLLHMAAAEGNYEVCEFLLKNGANPDIMADGHVKPIHLALQNDAVYELLLKYGAKKDVFTYCGRGEVEKLSEMMKTERVPTYKWMGDSGERRTLMAIAVVCHRKDVLEFLLKQKFPINDDENGVYALQLAAGVQDSDIAELLLKNGANPDALDRSGNSAMHFAYRLGDEKMKEVLRKYSARSNIKNKLGKTPEDYGIMAEEDRKKAASASAAASK